MRNEKINYWKTATLILVVMAVVLVIIIHTQQEVYSFGDFEISRHDFNLLTSALDKSGETQGILCSIKENKCINVSKIGGKNNG